MKPREHFDVFRRIITIFIIYVNENDWSVLDLSTFNMLDKQKKFA